MSCKGDNNLILLRTKYKNCLAGNRKKTETILRGNFGGKIKLFTTSFTVLLCNFSKNKLFSTLLFNFKS